MGIIRGVGVDIVEVSRFRGLMERRPRVLQRLFCPTELLTDAGVRRSAASLAARFAAKEAVAKSLGAPPGMHWTDCEIAIAASGAPYLIVRDTVLQIAQDRGVSDWHLSLSHDGDYAMAYVMAEGTDP